MEKILYNLGPIPKSELFLQDNSCQFEDKKNQVIPQEFLDDMFQLLK